jgi:dihydropteroate synthase
MYWDIGARTLDLAKRPLIMGILNITPDSFSDSALFNNPESAVDRALEMEAQGADIIDIGGESTRPYATPVSEKDELKRVLPVVEMLAGKLKIPISIDTYKSAVAKESLLRGAEIVNDISGFSFDSGMAEVVATMNAGVVLMHTTGKPAVMQEFTQYRCVTGEILSSLRRAITLALSHGIEEKRIVVDPGIGFGKDTGGNLEILRKLREFSVLGRPILVGASRKGFIGSILNRPVEDRIFGTAAAIALAVAYGASILRVHDVKEMRDVADMTMSILRAGLD